MAKTPTDVERLAEIRSEFNDGGLVAAWYAKEVTVFLLRLLDEREADIASFGISICGKCGYAMKSGGTCFYCAGYAMAELDAAINASIKRNGLFKVLGDPRVSVHVPPADWGLPQNTTIGPIEYATESVQEATNKAIAETAVCKIEELNDDGCKQHEEIPVNVERLAGRIASEIDVEHDETTQTNCSICQRVIPFIAQSLTAVAQAARTQALNEAAEKCDHAAREKQEDNAYWGGPSTWERSVIDAHRADAVTIRSLIPTKGEGP